MFETGKRSIAVTIGTLAVAAGMLLGSQSVLAVHENMQFPAAIHAGTCDAPGTAVSGLGTLVRLPEGAPEAGDVAGAEGATVVHGLPDDAEINVEISVTDLLATPHVVAVFDEAGANIIACGSIGAYTYEDGKDLAFGLQSVGDGGYTGAVIMNVEDDKVSDVQVFLVKAPAPSSATPAA